MNVLHHDLIYPLLPDYRRELDDRLIAARRRSSGAPRLPLLAALNRLTPRRSRRIPQ